MKPGASRLAAVLAATALLLPGASRSADPFPVDIEIYVIGVDGNGRRNLTARPRLQDTSPVVSPDGKRIVFLRGLATQTDIWAMNVDGSGQAQRTSSAEQEIDPAWAPDNRTLAFTFSAGAGPPSIRVLAESGAGPRRANAQHARFAPRGQLLAFLDVTPGRRAIAAMRRDGRGYRALFRANVGRAVWSPLAKRLAYERIVGSRTYVSVMNADGSKRKRLALGADPVWSSRGLIAFVRGGDIFVVQPNGRGLRRLTSGAEEDSFPAWSRDGRRLAFLRKLPGGSAQLYLVNADRTGLVAVTRERGGVDVARPAWSVDGRQLFYAAMSGRPPPA